MTRKDYVAIAQIIQNVRYLVDRDGESDHIAEVARQLANYMRGDNPRFDRSRFMQACGIEVKQAA